MLLEVSFSNILSFKNKVSLVLHAKKQDRLTNENSIYKYSYKIKNNKQRTEKIYNGSIIYGANGSGKTNFLCIISYLVNFIKNPNALLTKSVKLPYIDSFAFTKEHQYSDCEFIFLENINGVDYQITYYMKFDINGGDISKIIQEKVSYKLMDKTKQYSFEEILIFERLENDITFKHTNIKYVLDNIQNDNLEQTSVLFNLINNINKLDYDLIKDKLEYILCRKLYLNFKEKFAFINSLDKDMKYWDRFGKKINTDHEYKMKLLYFLKKLDFAISDIYYDEDMYNSLKEVKQINSSILLQVALKTKHTIINEDYELPMSLESTGTNKFLLMFSEIYSAMSNDSIIFIDEIDAQLHPFISEELLSILIGQENLFPEAHYQFITTSHDIDLASYFSQNQIYIVNKDYSQISKMYSLVEFEDDIDFSTFKNKYFDGRYGGIPLIK